MKVNKKQLSWLTFWLIFWLVVIFLSFVHFSSLEEAIAIFLIVGLILGILGLLMLIGFIYDKLGMEGKTG